MERDPSKDANPFAAQANEHPVVKDFDALLAKEGTWKFSPEDRAWDVVLVDAGSAEYCRLMLEGWEPFACSPMMQQGQTTGALVSLRKQVRPDKILSDARQSRDNFHRAVVRELEARAAAQLGFDENGRPIARAPGLPR